MTCPFPRARCLSGGALRVYFIERDRSHGALILESLGTFREALAEYLKMEMPVPVQAYLAPDRKNFESLVLNVLGVKIETPSNPRRIAQACGTGIVLLSPAAYGDSPYVHVTEDFIRMARHEMVHLCEEHLNPGLAETGPLWWSEGLAVFLSGQWKHTGQFRFREPVENAVRTGELPSLGEIAENPGLAYEFGWTMVRFMARETIRAVLAGSQEPGEAATAMEKDWRSWLLRGSATG